MDKPFILKRARTHGHIAHVIVIRTQAELRRITPLLREAYRLAAAEDAG